MSRHNSTAKTALLLCALPFIGGAIGFAIDLWYEATAPVAPSGPYMPLLPLLGFAIGAGVLVLLLLSFGVARAVRRSRD